MDLDSVLKQMRTEYTPNDDDRKRVENALTATLVAGSITGAAHLAASGTGASIKGAIAKGSLQLLPVWLKGAIGVGATVAAVGGGVYGVREYRAQQNAAANAVAITSATAVEAKAPPASPHVVAPAAPQTALPVVQSTVPVQDTDARVDAASAARGEVPQVARHTAVRHSPTRAPAISPQLTSLGELKLIAQASRALQDGRAVDAEEALREHERRYTHTALGQERAGLALLARCANGSAGVADDADKFLQNNANSPLAARIKRECLK